MTMILTRFLYWSTFCGMTCGQFAGSPPFFLMNSSLARRYLTFSVFLDHLFWRAIPALPAAATGDRRAGGGGVPCVESVWRKPVSDSVSARQKNGSGAPLSIP